MRHRTNQALYGYWNEVRGMRLAPRRFDIEPSRIADILPDTFILERSDNGSFRFRLAGTRICDQVGIELRGQDFLDLWEEDDRKVVGGEIDALTQRGAVVRIGFAAETEAGQGMRIECLLLPLLHSATQVDRVLGGWAALDVPAWSGSVTVARLRLTEHEVIWPDGRPFAALHRGHQQTPFHPYVQTARLVRQDRRQFRVYDGGRAGEFKK